MALLPAHLFANRWYQDLQAYFHILICIYSTFFVNCRCFPGNRLLVALIKVLPAIRKNALTFL